MEKKIKFEVIKAKLDWYKKLSRKIELMLDAKLEIEDYATEVFHKIESIESECSVLEDECIETIELKPLSEIRKNREHLKEFFEFATGGTLDGKQTSEKKTFVCMFGNEGDDFRYFTIYFKADYIDTKYLKQGVTYFDVVNWFTEKGYTPDKLKV